jgi:hypothetical protein
LLRVSRRAQTRTGKQYDVGDERLQCSSRAAVPSRYVVVKLPLTHPRRQQTSCRQRNRIVGDPPLSVPMRPWSADAEGLGVQRSGAPSRAYQLLCGCSYKIRCEVMRHGERLGELTFFDDEEASVTQGERVRYCPGCRSRLSLLSVRPRGWIKTQSRCGKSGR